ncbi:glycoside hydrolase family 10 protein [Parabacteroides provencensis]|uniref:glycoside hydrolase family 10 protein n=1 Tax=Parabacteroides provencensis TaxID=1944636 RepID=UPI000C14E023|nr:family 10 glycosylhydrolase [Parabacteroides provencensis]
MKRYCWLLLWALWIQSAFAMNLPKHEVRAVWLTTVYGLDWPHRPATTQAGIKAQQQELCNILDRLQNANFNTVFLQVRLRGNVIYRSAIEPASKVFSGKEGVMPGYDPLAFAIKECHKRGMECHAWFVTFPLGTAKNVKEQGRLSVVKRQPKLCKLHNGEWYLDPGVPGTTNYILSLVKEIVNNYDVDGIHFDYIRYPEQANRFPDKNVYKMYGKKEPLDSWRRNNINRMVVEIYDWVKQAKPWVQVSSSPLGKYNRIPRVPDAGWTAYESVFQDPKMWMLRGKQDMIVPMMYYLHDNFFPFVDNWVENCNGRLVVPGLGAYRMDKKEADWTVNDITDQIDYSRYYGGAGCAFFRCENVLDNSKGLYDELVNVYYKYPAQLPPLTWLNNTVPSSPEEVYVQRAGNELKLSWQKPASEKQDLTYTVYYSLSDSIDSDASKCILMTNVHANEIYMPVDSSVERGYTFSVSASTRYHIEGAPSKETYYYLSDFPK